MPTLNRTAEDFGLNSSFTACTIWNPTPPTWTFSVSTPSIPTNTINFDTSSIPVGATINSALLSCTAGGSKYGGIAKQAGSTTLVDLDIKASIVKGGTTPVQYSFQSSTAGVAYPQGISGQQNCAARSGTCTFSNISLVVSYTDPYTVCTAPSSVTLSKNSALPNDSATLSWSGAGNGTNNVITGFQICRATVEASPYTALGSKINDTDGAGSATVNASGTNGETYYYKILTYGTVAGFDSELSTTSASLKAEVSACSPPTSISLNGTNVAPGASKTLSWSGAAAGANNPITKYEVHRATSAGGTYSYLGETTGSSLAVTSPTGNNSSYYYKIKAIGTVSGYDSGLSSSYGVLTTTVSAPVSPSIVSVANGTDAAPGKTRTLSWSGAVAGTNDTIRGYHVWRSLNGGAYAYLAEFLTTNTSGSLVVTSASSAGTYTYKVKTLGNSFSLESGLSSNYGSLTTVAIKSTGTFDKTQVTADDATQISLTITPQPDTAYTHKVTWYLHPVDYTSGQRSLVVADYSDTLTVPAAWVAGIAQLSATGTCLVETFNGAESLGNNSYTFTIAVPQASSFVLDKTTVEANGIATIQATVTAGHSTYSHEVTWYANDTYKSVNTIAAGVAYHQLTVPLSWCNASPNSDTFAASCTVKTYKSAGTVLVGMVSITFTITVPASVLPTVSSFTAAQIEGYWSLYVKTKSKCRLTLTAAGAYGSTVNSFRIVGAGQDSLSQAYSAGVQWTSAYLQIMGSQTFTVTITDSRGRIKQGTVSITVTDYSPPSITAATYDRAISGGDASNTGTYIKAKATFTFSAIGSNAITAKTYYRQQGSGTWLPAGGTTITSNTAVTHGGGTIALANAYETKIDLTDTFGTVTNLGSVPVATKVFDLRETRASFGRYATNDKELAIPADWDFVKGSTKVSYEGHLHSYAPLTGGGTSGTWSISISGSAATLTTARTLTLGATGKTFNGSANVSWSLAEIGAAAASHGNHVPTAQTANNAVFLRNDNSWQTVTPANIGAAAASHGNHVPTTGTANNAIFLRNDNSWQTVTPANIGAAASTHTHSYAPLTGAGTSGTWPINITGSAGYAASAGRAYPYRSDGAALNFYWSGQAGQPTWLWGGSDGSNMYVYNPSNFSVAAATRANGKLITSGAAYPGSPTSGDIHILI